MCVVKLYKAEFCIFRWKTCWRDDDKIVVFTLPGSPSHQSRSQRSQSGGSTLARPRQTTWGRRANPTLTRGDAHADTDTYHKVIHRKANLRESLSHSRPSVPGRYFMLVVALHAQSHSQSYTVAAQASERIIVRVTSGHVCLPPTTIIFPCVALLWMFSRHCTPVLFTPTHSEMATLFIFLISE